MQIRPWPENKPEKKKKKETRKKKQRPYKTKKMTQVRCRESHTVLSSFFTPIIQQQSLSPTETDTLYPGKGIFTYQGEGIRGNIEKQVRDVNEKLQEQAATYHEGFVTTSWNNMAQYTENATSLMKEKYQELQANLGTLHKSLSTSLDQLQKAREQSLRFPGN